MNLIIVSILIVFILFYLIKIKKRRDIARKIQGPKYIPLLGYVPIYFLSFEHTLPFLNKLQKQFNRFYKIWIGPEFWFVCYDPKLSEKILTDQTLVKSNDYKFLEPWLGHGLLTNEGKSWFVKRKAITPAFHFTILDGFIEIFEKHSENLINNKFIKNNMNIIDVTPHLLHCAFDIICETSMGIETNSETIFVTEYVKAVHDVAEICYKRMFNPFLQPEWIFWFLKDRKILYKSLKVIEEITQKVIDERRKTIQQQQQVDNVKGFTENVIDYTVSGNKKKKSLLDTLLTTTIDGKSLTDNEIKDEVNTFFFAGHDTTASTLGFLLYNIAKYKDVQEKIYEEIKQELYENDKITKLNINKLNNLTYLDLVIKESMRMHTTVPFIGRQTINDYQLDDILIPYNTNLSIFIYGMFHDENLFPEPEKFIPERFVTKYNAEEFNPFAYIPFSAGHRNCIGQKFALLELKTIIVKIMEKFEIKLGYPDKELVLLAGMILKTKDGVNLQFKLRI